MRRIVAVHHEDFTRRHLDEHAPDAPGYEFRCNEFQLARTARPQFGALHKFVEIRNQHIDCIICRRPGQVGGFGNVVVLQRRFENNLCPVKFGRANRRDHSIFGQFAANQTYVGSAYHGFGRDAGNLVGAQCSIGACRNAAAVSPLGIDHCHDDTGAHRTGDVDKFGVDSMAAEIGFGHFTKGIFADLADEGDITIAKCSLYRPVGSCSCRHAGGPETVDDLTRRRKLLALDNHIDVRGPDDNYLRNPSSHLITSM